VTITRNRARCRKCDTIIESFSVHDFKYCKCRAIFVDGGREYARRGGELENCEELSEGNGDVELLKNPGSYEPPHSEHPRQIPCTQDIPAPDDDATGYK